MNRPVKLELIANGTAAGAGMTRIAPRLTPAGNCLLDIADDVLIGGLLVGLILLGLACADILPRF